MGPEGWGPQGGSPNLEKVGPGRVGPRKGGAPEGWGPEGWGPGRVGAGGAPKGGGPKISRFFFLLPPPCSFFFLSLGIFSCLFFSLRVSSRVFFPLSVGSSRGILVVFEAPGRSNVRVWSSMVGGTRTFERPGLQKHHQHSTRRHPEREEKNEFCGGRGKKKSDILGGPGGGRSRGRVVQGKGGPGEGRSREGRSNKL